MAINLDPSVLERTLDQYTPEELGRMCALLDKTFDLIRFERDTVLDDSTESGLREIEIKVWRDDAPTEAKLCHMLIDSLLSYRAARGTNQRTLF